MTRVPLETPHVARPGNGAAAPAVADSCTTVAIDVRRAEVTRLRIPDSADERFRHLQKLGNPELIRTMRADELPRAVEAIRENLPDVDAEAEFVAKRLTNIADPQLRASLEDDALDEWDATLYTITEAMEPMEETLHALPWCDHRKHGW